MIYILTCILVITLIFLLNVYRGELISPSILFTVSFLFSSIWASFYAKRWGLGLHINTTVVILGGILTFILFSAIIHVVFSNFSINKGTLTVIKINNIILYAIIIFELISIIYIIKNVSSSVGMNIRNYSQAAIIYRNGQLTGNIYQISKLASLMYTVDISIGYWFGNILVRNYVASKKIDVKLAVIVLLSIISASLQGSRTYSINIIIAAIGMLLLFSKSNIKSRLSFKNLRNISLILIGMVLTFEFSGRILGRESIEGKVTLLDYLAKYCGAPIKNLDTYLQHGHPDAPIFGGQTFYSLIINHLDLFGIPNKYVLDIPFQWYQNFALGNVYTTFYSYIYDFGYIGVPILIGIMAIISQIFYELAKRYFYKEIPSFSVFVLSYITPCLLLSFFSNKFYENMLTVTFFKVAILYIIYNFILYLSIKLKK